MRILIQILMVFLILSSCKKQLIRNEPIFNDLISEIVDTAELNTIDSSTNKIVIGYRKNLAYPIPSDLEMICLLYTSPSPRDQRGSRMPSSA